MSIIKKPSAVDSPYIVPTPTAPTRLASSPVAGGGVNTVAADVAPTVSANADANTSSTSTGSNVSYYTAGIEGVNQLTTYGRIFAGANVYVTLEQPQYITYNQNYTGSGTVGGSDGQVQFNNNGNFGGSTNLTFDGANLVIGGQVTSAQLSTTGSITGGNVLTGGRISAAGNVTGNYILGNGSQLTGINSTSSFLANGSARFTLLSDYTLLSGTTTSPHNFKINDTYTPDIDLRNSSGTGMFTQGASATIRTAGTYNWNFGSTGTTSFPNGVLQAPANTELDIQSTTTNSDDNRLRLDLTAVDLYAYNSNANSYSELFLDNSNVAAPNAAIVVKANGSPELRWTFDAVGNLTLPTNTSSINYANGDPYGGTGGGVANKIFNGNTYANIDFPSGNLAVGVNVQPVTGAWINTYGNIVVNDQYNSEGESVLIDGGGNVFVTGASFNPDFNQDQAFVRKLGPSGQVMWQKSLPQSAVGTVFSSGETLGQDGSGNIYWLANLWDGGGTGRPMVAKLNSSTGESIWTTYITGVRYGYDMTVNSAGQVFVVTNADGRITSLNANGTVAWSRDPSDNGTSIVDTGTYVIIGYGSGTVGAYDYSGNLLWTNQVFNTGQPVWGLAWDGTNWYAADENGYVMKISGADNSTILWQKHINRNGTGGNIFLTWIEYSAGYIYAVGTGNVGGSGIITVKINATTGGLEWARSLKVGGAGQWYWYGHHDISVRGSYYAITGQGYPANSYNTKQVLAQLPTDGSLAGSTVGPYRYVDLPALVLDTVSVAGTGYNGSPSQPATVSVTPDYTLVALVAPGSEVNILEPFVTGALWTFNNDNVLTLPSGGQLGASGMGWTGLHGGNGYPLDVTGYYSSGNVSSQVFFNPSGSLNLTTGVDGGDTFSWTFNPDGSLTPPTQASNQRTGTGLVLKIGDENTQAIITGPAPVANSYNAAPRLVVAGQDGVLNGEGGDVYLWAGQSGPDGGTGGDIKVDGGLGLNGSEGGTIKVRSGNSVGGTGGFIEILGGHGDFGGPVSITSGYGNSQANSANVTITTPYGGNWIFDNYGNLTLPNGALLKDTSGDSVAFGQNAGANSQYQHAVAIGLNAGYQYQGEDSVAIGFNAGYYNQGRGVAIGYQAGQGTDQSIPVSATYGGSGPAHVYVSGTGNPSLVLDSVSGVVTYNQYVTGNNIPLYTYVTNIYPGEDRIEISQPPTAALAPGDAITFIGSNIGVASTSSLVAGARVLGTNIPDNTYINNILGPNNIDISQRPSAPLVDGDYLEFYIGQGEYATAIGYDAGIQYQDVNAVAVGRSAGTNHQGANTVAVGYVAGAYSQGANAVAIGAFAGAQTQGMNTVAIGYRSGDNTQGARAVAIGEDAGRETQGNNAIAIGLTAGYSIQGNVAVAMGWNAGYSQQGLNAIAIGEDAGYSQQGAYSIAIGLSAGYNLQANNSIILNATGNHVNTITANSFTVKPVRNASTGNVLYYDQSSGEITFDAGGTANTGNFVFDSYDLDGTTFDEIALGGTNSGNILINAPGLVTVVGGYESDGMTAGAGNVYLFNGDPSFANGIPQSGVGYIWQFDNGGNLNLPRGGVVYETNIPSGGLSGNTIALMPSGGTNTDQQLLIYPTITVDANHLHVTSGNLYNTELFLGNDNLYVKLANTGNIVINSDNGVGGTGQWTFDTNGNLQLPGTHGSLGTSNSGYTTTLQNDNTYVAIDGDNGVVNIVTNGGSTEYTFVDNFNATSSANVLSLITRNGDSNPVNSKPQIVFGYNGTTDYPQFIHTIHNAGTSVNNRIELWTSDGTQSGTFPANAVLGLTVTNGNIVTGGILTDNYYYANGAPVSFGGSSYGNANVVANLAALGSNPVSTTGNITSGNLLTGGLISAIGNITSGNIRTAGLISAAGNVTAQNFIGNISITGNVTGTSSNVQLVAGAYTWTFDNTGNVTLPTNGDLIFSANTTMTSVSNGNITIDPNGTGQLLVTSTTPAQFGNTVSVAGNVTVSGSGGVKIPNLPAFRVYGNGVTSGLSTTVNGTGILNGNNWAVDYNQGSYLNSSTGYFTAPVAGLYQVNLVARCANNSAPASQAVVIKNYGTGNVNQVMWEIAANSTVNHFGVSTTSKLAVGDTLVLKVTQGNVTFDINDNWSVVFLG